MSTQAATPATLADHIHIPPPPRRARPQVRALPGDGRLRRAGRALTAALGEASLAGFATLSFAWAAAELAFVLLRP